ncbi:MAG: bacteriohopanetetrol glucosamine biosynthesis glycosyltransferase HpnI [Anaerolineae bacterium]|nr:bacteriohopanetetrol glucosamine biosynthesis glycosyltransferase HpnI [Anaerolineae bacterium]
MVETALSLLTFASWVYWLVAWWHVRAFFRSRPELPDDFTPPVSILKPVKGLDAQAYENFISFCQQDYPDFELVFGVADPADPAIPVIKRLQQDCPQRDIRLIVTPVIGTNRKASTLHTLALEARHNTLVVSDSDIRVTPEYLRRVVAPLANERIGLVTCLYRGEAALSLTARLEALHMGVTFLPSVLIARKFLDMRFALGATLALRRDTLARIGGFAAVTDYLADDYQVGTRVAALGLKVYLSDYIVRSVLGATTFRDQWDREVRWIRCARVSRPMEFPGMLLTFTTPLATVFALVSGFSAEGQHVLVVSLLLRWLVAWRVTHYTNDRESRRWLLLLPIRDMLSALVWCAGAMGRKVTWRGESFLVTRDGRLKPLRRSQRRGLPALLEKGIRSLDGLLRRCYHIHEFTEEEDCILRLALAKSGKEITLSDGTTIHRGDYVGELHLWNERVPPMPPEGPNLAWALAFQRQMERSLQCLATYVEAEPRFRHVKAFRGDLAFGSGDEFDQLASAARHWGFDLLDHRSPHGLTGRFVDFWHRVYRWGLIWAFNPGSLNSKRLSRLRPGEFWISRRKLLERYGTRQRGSYRDHQPIMEDLPTC